ncbi:Panacea domain-containing protein [Bradyrhizobium diazoefficiens]|uniref:Antitoxin SocA-like Panacea domain-containing protein n=1 Tax=Bradyrhizobium diazoefficiens TaxID=1355477 RepID=A0A809Y1P1_9BRAD|nr:hypothetical protein XF2B_78550 [Bradyrhizobium diazoefficiens]BCF21164.1 hypothetical protein XF13B_78550 [Bradyrhizobium diazoefficiens]
MPDFVPKTPAWFDTRKAAQVVAFFALKAGGKINILRATKLVYLADRLSMQKRDYAITGDNYVSMPFGPVNTNTYDFMNGRGSRNADDWTSFIGKRVDNDLPLAKGIDAGSLDELSRSDIAILEETWANFSDIEKYQLAEWTHRFCPEWQNPGGSSIPIDFSTVYLKLGKADPAGMAEEIQAERKLKLDRLAG